MVAGDALALKCVCAGCECFGAHQAAKGNPDLPRYMPIVPRKLIVQCPGATSSPKRRRRRGQRNGCGKMVYLPHCPISLQLPVPFQTPMNLSALRVPRFTPPPSARFRSYRFTFGSFHQRGPKASSSSQICSCSKPGKEGTPCH